jgi:DNA-binding transcriptional ArsR family regulator
MTGATLGGEPDIAEAAALFADRTRARVLMALIDGRALPASVLASEAGVSAQAASAQLARLTSAGFLAVERSGRHRYYRLANPQVVSVLCALAPLAAVPPVTSLRQSTRAAALRAGRTCYDHLAGRLGTAVTQGLIDRGVLVPTDGICDTRRRDGEPLSSQLSVHPYVLGDAAAAVLGDLGVPADRLDGGVHGGRAGGDRGTRRRLLRFCLDWTEQRHHLAGRLGADLLTAFLDAGWVTRAPQRRALRLTSAGEEALRDHLGFVGRARIDYP